MPGTYSVRAASSIARRGAGHNRRRAGIVFGEGETVISTTKGVEGAVIVTELQLRAILADSNLRPTASPETTEPGLRAKAVVPDDPSREPLIPLAKNGMQSNDAEEAPPDEDEEPGAPKRPRGRPRKA